MIPVTMATAIKRVRVENHILTLIIQGVAKLGGEEEMYFNRTITVKFFSPSCSCFSLHFSRFMALNSTSVKYVLFSQDYVNLFWVISGLMIVVHACYNEPHSDTCMKLI